MWKYICDGYWNQTEETNWKSKIMFSKWWLPIFKIKMVDDYNYDRFLKASLFSKVLTDLSIPKKKKQKGCFIWENGIRFKKEVV